MKASLLKRMILAQGLVLVLGWIAAWGITLGHLYWSQGIFDPTLEMTASALAVLLQDETDPAHFNFQAKRIQELDETFSSRDSDFKPGEYKSIYQIFDRNGRLLFRSAAAPESLLTSEGPGFHSITIHGEPWRVFVKEEPTNRLRVMVGQPRFLAQRLIYRGVLKSSIVYLIAFLVLALLTWLVARRALKPIRDLAEVVEARNPGDLSPLEAPVDLAETRPLIGALNRLFHRVEDLLVTQRRFVTDAAHELRTPLAVIGAQAHVLEHAKVEAEQEIAGRELQQGVARAAQLVGQLLSVARLDVAAQTAAKMMSLDLAALAQERVGMLVPQALVKAQDLGYEGSSNLPWNGDASILISAVDNLLINAIRYTPSGGRITLRLKETENEALLEVEDTGPGIPPEFRETVFERFSRLPGTQETGSGLGLAIVRRAVELHGGRVVLADGAGESGLLAVIHLPRLSSMPG